MTTEGIPGATPGTTTAVVIPELKFDAIVLPGEFKEPIMLLRLFALPRLDGYVETPNGCSGKELYMSR